MFFNLWYRLTLSSAMTKFYLIAVSLCTNGIDKKFTATSLTHQDVPLEVDK